MAIVGESVVGAIAFRIEIAESDEEAAIVRIILQRGAKAFFGFVEFIDAGEGIGEIDESAGVTGLRFDGFFKHDDGFANVALLDVKDAEIIAGFGEFRIGIDGGFELSFGGVAVAIGKFEKAELIVRGSKAGIEFDGAFEFAARVGVIAEMIKRHSQGEMCVGGIGIEGERVAVLIVRGCGAAFGESCVALMADVASFTFYGECFLDGFVLKAFLLGAIELAVLAVQKNELLVDFRIFGIEPLGALELGEGGGVAVGFSEKCGGEAAPFEIVGIEADGLESGIGSLRPLLEGLVSEGLEMEGVGIARI